MKQINLRKFLAIVIASACLVWLLTSLLMSKAGLFESRVSSPDGTAAISSNFSEAQPALAQVVLPEAISLQNVGTSDVYFAHKGKPLLSFGGMSDFIFYVAKDAFDYELWADWAAEHGMNHIRAYPPNSWEYIEKVTKGDRGSTENMLFPYEETSPGSREFDLTKFNEAYWQRFRQQCEYLQSKGIVVHMLMINGWQFRDYDSNWSGHFFNPKNNINSFTDGLADNRLAFYKSVADGNDELVEAQKAWFRKIVEETADLDNVYYDLVHELAEHYEDWDKAQVWIETMAQTVRSHFASLQPEKAIILGMDVGGLEPDQREWLFTRPYFDVLIYGKAHKVDQAVAWRERYNKPYIPQESWDDSGRKYSLRNQGDRTHLRKYLWKFMMAKCQQMDIYSKPLDNDPKDADLEHNYNPDGRTRLEDDALVLRELWNQLTDYANLDFEGQVRSGPGKHRFVLSSDREALVYLSSDTGKQGVNFAETSLALRGLALAEGTYKADIIRPDTGTDATVTVTVNNGRAAIALPAFTDDLAVHIFRDSAVS